MRQHTAVIDKVPQETPAFLRMSQKNKQVPQPSLAVRKHKAK